MTKKLLILFFVFIFLGFKFISQTTPYKFDVIDYFPKMPMSTVNPVTNEGAALGRLLFYDSILSVDYSMSCATCHKQKFAFTDQQQFSKGVNEVMLKRNTMPLFNLAWYPSFFWDGKANSIENQVFFPVSAHNEMNLNWKTAEKRINKSKLYRSLFIKAFGLKPIDSLLISYAIAQFERSLISNHSKFDNVLNGQEYLSADEYEGYGLINDQTKGDCLHCHLTDGNGLGTNQKFSNNGLDNIKNINNYKDNGLGKISGNQSDIGLFKVPSLRNLSFTAPYMHDGRFKSLKEVLNFYSEGVNNSINVDSKMSFAHKGGAHLTNSEKDKIIKFLLTLNDSVFVTNPKFSNPFILSR